MQREKCIDTAPWGHLSGFLAGLIALGLGVYGISYPTARGRELGIVGIVCGVITIFAGWKKCLAQNIGGNIWYAIWYIAFGVTFIVNFTYALRITYGFCIACGSIFLFAGLLNLLNLEIPHKNARLYTGVYVTDSEIHEGSFEPSEESSQEVYTEMTEVIEISTPTDTDYTSPNVTLANQNKQQSYEKENIE